MEGDRLYKPISRFIWKRVSPDARRRISQIRNNGKFVDKKPIRNPKCCPKCNHTRDPKKTICCEKVRLGEKCGHWKFTPGIVHTIIPGLKVSLNRPVYTLNEIPIC